MMDTFSALALLGSGLVSTAGQLYANKANINFQRMVNDVNWQMAAMNNATQINMANTAHQREVADLRAAGLNPILSAGGSGSVTPSLQTARQDSAQVENPVAGIAHSAKELAHYVSQEYDAQLNNIRSQNDILQSEAKKANWDASTARQDSELHSIDNELRLNALNDLAYKSEKDGNGIWQQVLDKDSDYYKKYRKGLEASAALQASKYFRENFNSAVQGVNSATSVIQALGGLRRSGSWSNLFR